MTPLGNRILKEFEELDKDRLDLHALFEAAGNEPDARNAVVEAVDDLTREGLLESRGGDFYSLTPKARASLASRSRPSPALFSGTPGPTLPPDEPPFPQPDPDPEPGPQPDPNDPVAPRPIS